MNGPKAISVRSCARMSCAVPRSPGRRDAIAQGNVDRRALKGSPQYYRWTAFPLKRQSADDIITEPITKDEAQQIAANVAKLPEPVAQIRFPTARLFDQASAEQRMARARCLVLHPFIHFLCPEQLLVIGERTRTPSRITFGSSPSSARTSAKRASTRSSIAVPRSRAREGTDYRPQGT